MGIDKSNPFEREGDEVELYREFGSGGRKIEFETDKGAAEGLSPASYGIGKPGGGATVNDS